MEAAPVITAITPSHARIGETVILTGTNFWPLLGADSVSFNGVTTPIATVSATSLTCAVPGGATTGPVVLSTPTGNATAPFIVDPEPFVLVGPPVLSSLSRSVAPAGATLTLSGSNFDPVLSGNLVLFAGGTATPSIGTPTSLTVIVPPGAGTGPVRVQTGTGTSAGAPFVYVDTLGGTFTP
ncbi:IPT/TIG domain protein [compost metagenome]